MKVKITKKDNSVLEIEGEVSKEDFASERDISIEHLGKTVKIDGFREGKVPQKILEDRLGEARILQEMAQRALEKAYPKIIDENKIDAIGRPDITITKIAKDNPLGFKIIQATMPEFSLPDYKKIAKKETDKKEDEPKVEEKEIEGVINQISQDRKKNPGDEKEEIPPLDDEFVKTLGNFKNVEDFKTKLKENMLAEKKMRARDKKRIEILEAIIKETKIELPQILIEREMDRLLEEAKADIARSGLKWEDYLKHLQKEEADIRKGFEETGRKRAMSGLILDAIAKAEGVTPDKEKVEAEVKKLMEQYPGADKMSATNYIEGLFKNDAVFAMLETN